MNDDAELLRRYADENSQEAFAELVQRHLGVVYHAALRQAGGDAHRAQDIAQIVFTDLARKAGEAAKRPVLVAWLYTSVRYAAAHMARTDHRRQAREQKVYVMNELLGNDSSPAEWEQMRPVIDDVLHALNERDREAVLLRFFEGFSFSAIGEKFATSEDAARMRVERALEKMRGLLARRGVTSTGVALGLALTSQAGAAVPAGLATTISGAAIAGAATAGTAATVGGILTIMSTTKVVTGIVGVVALLAVGTALYQKSAAQESAAALATANAERDVLQLRFAASEKHARETDDALAAVRKDLSDLRAKPATPVPTPAPTQTGTSNVGAAMAYVLEHPELQATHLQQQTLRAKMRYDRFVKQAGLSPTQQEQLFKALEEGFTGELDLMAALHAKGYGVGNLPTDPRERAQLQQLSREYQEKRLAGLRTALGDDGMQKFEQYTRMLPERNVADAVAGQLYYTESPLTGSQAEQLTRILTENRFKAGDPSADNTMGGDYVLTQPALSARRGQAMQRGAMTMYDWQNPITDAAIARAQSILDPAQLTALKRMQAEQVTQFQLAPPPPTAGAAGK